jgi:predicted nucleotidyltransferase
VTKQTPRTEEKGFDKKLQDDKISLRIAKNGMKKIKEQISDIASRYGLQIIYVFGSRAKEALDLVENRVEHLRSVPADLDIGVKPEKFLAVEEKVKIAISFEDLFDVSRVDLVVLPEAPVSLALEIVTGEILFMQDSTYEAEYQLYVMRQAADLLPYERMKQEMIMGD